MDNFAYRVISSRSILFGNPNGVLSEREGLSIAMVLLDIKWVGGWIISGGWKAHKSIIFVELFFLTSLGCKKFERG